MQTVKLCALLCVLFSLCASALQESKIRTDKHARIAGGVATSTGEFPYLAGIYSISGGNYYCAGALISKRYVLTAGHCMIDEASNIKVVVGRNDLSETTIGRDVTVLQKIVHADYNDDTVQNDIALLQLAEDVLEDVSANIQYVDITSTPPQVGTSLWAASWGAHPASEAYSTIAFKVQLQVRSEKAPCSAQHPYNFCAGNGDGKTICEGDSGSSIVYRADNSSRWTSYGITSYSTGERCGDIGSTGAYTNVSMYHDWILTNMVNVTSTISPTTTAGVTTTSVPTTTKAATTSASPTPVITTGAVTTTKAPTTSSPVTTTQAPITTATPATTKAPTTSTTAPTSTTNTLVPTSTLSPSTTTSAPTTTTPTTRAPTSTTTPTTVPTSSPSTTTRAPVTPTEIPTTTKPTLNSASSTTTGSLCVLATLIVILMY